jgi:hypothetical protein
MIGMTTLYQIGCHGEDGKGADVVFVHGLSGDWRKTWQAKNQPCLFWPTWLAEDIRNIAVWSLSYQAAAIRWKGFALTLDERARNVLPLLSANGIGHRPAIFITHSLGGLLVKRLLQNASRSAEPEHRAMLRQTRGVVFLGVPHYGARLANWLMRIPIFLPNAIVDDLAHNSPALLELNAWFREHSRPLGIRVQAFSERRRRFLLNIVAKATDSALSVEAVPVDDDHVSISKPGSRESVIYLAIKRFVQDCQRLGDPRICPPGQTYYIQNCATDHFMDVRIHSTVSQHRHRNMLDQRPRGGDRATVGLHSVPRCFSDRITVESDVCRSGVATAKYREGKAKRAVRLFMGAPFRP